eukprot:6193022-Pleurochrysis_carterae.AAC.1
MAAEPASLDLHAPCSRSSSAARSSTLDQSSRCDARCVLARSSTQEDSSNASAARSCKSAKTGKAKGRKRRAFDLHSRKGRSVCSHYLHRRYVLALSGYGQLVLPRNGNEPGHSDLWAASHIETANGKIEAMPGVERTGRDGAETLGKRRRVWWAVRGNGAETLGEISPRCLRRILRNRRRRSRRPRSQIRSRTQS